MATVQFSRKHPSVITVLLTLGVEHQTIDELRQRLRYSRRGIDKITQWMHGEKLIHVAGHNRSRRGTPSRVWAPGKGQDVSFKPLTRTQVKKRYRAKQKDFKSPGLAVRWRGDCGSTVYRPKLPDQTSSTP